MEAMIGLPLSWPDEWCAVMSILCQKILSVSRYICAQACIGSRGPLVVTKSL